MQWRKLEADILKLIPHFTVKYEEHLENTEVWQTTSEQIFRYLNVPTSHVKSRLQKTYDKPYSTLVENYDELIYGLKELHLGDLTNWKNQ